MRQEGIAMNDDLLKKAYINAFSINDKYIKDMIIINTKSLIDDISQRYVKIDKNRLKMNYYIISFMEIASKT